MNNDIKTHKINKEDFSCEYSIAIDEKTLNTNTSTYEKWICEFAEQIKHFSNNIKKIEIEFY